MRPDRGAIPATNGAPPKDVPARRRPGIDWPVLTAQALLTAVLLAVACVQAFVTAPALKEQRRALEEIREGQARRDAEQAERERQLQRLREAALVETAEARLAADRQRRLAEENLKLAEELNRKLRGPDGQEEK